MKVAGIDYSTRAVDIVTVPYEDAGYPEWFHFPLNGSDSFNRARDVARIVFGPSWQFWDDMVAIGIEHPGGKFGTGDMLRIQGAVIGRIPPQKLLYPIPPARWKSLNGMPGNASKAHVADVVHTAWPDLAATWTQDACDAYCIALATRGQVEAQ